MIINLMSVCTFAGSIIKMISKLYQSMLLKTLKIQSGRQNGHQVIFDYSLLDFLSTCDNKPLVCLQVFEVNKYNGIKIKPVTVFNQTGSQSAPITYTFYYIDTWSLVDIAFSVCVE